MRDLVGQTSCADDRSCDEKPGGKAIPGGFRAPPNLRLCLLAILTISANPLAAVREQKALRPFQSARAARMKAGPRRVVWTPGLHGSNWHRQLRRLGRAPLRRAQGVAGRPLDHARAPDHGSTGDLAGLLPLPKFFDADGSHVRTIARFEVIVGHRQLGQSSTRSAIRSTNVGIRQFGLASPPRCDAPVQLRATPRAHFSYFTTISVNGGR